MTVLTELLEMGYEIKIHTFDVGNQDHLTLTLVHTKYDDAELIVLHDDEYVVKEGEVGDSSGFIGVTRVK